MSRLLTGAARHRPWSLSARTTKTVTGSSCAASAGVFVGDHNNGNNSRISCVQRPFHGTSSALEDASPRHQHKVEQPASAGNRWEWDPEYKNPMWRPKYSGRARILRSDDFRRRPKVGFSVSFSDIHQSGVALTWMTHKQQKEIFEVYKLYLKTGWEKYHVTSHEYVVRMIADKWKLTPERVAGVIQLQFNEAKYRIDGTTEVLDDVGEYMDNCFLTEIRRCYKAYGMQPPIDLSIVEWSSADGVAKQECQTMTEVADIFDYDTAWKKFQNEYLPEKAKNIISNHVCKEDVYDNTILTPVDEETLGLLDRQKELSEKSKQCESEYTPDEIRQTADADLPDRRKRWKYVAKLVNTRALKEKRRQAHEKPILGWKQPKTRNLMPTSYCNDNMENTLVEKGGSLRRATMEDIKNVAWKPRRYHGTDNTLEESVAIQEKIYREAKIDWLNYINGRPHTGVFGQDENAMKPVVRPTETETNTDSSVRLEAEKDEEVDLGDQEEEDPEVVPFGKEIDGVGDDEDGDEPPKL